MLIDQIIVIMNSKKLCNLLIYICVFILSANISKTFAWDNLGGGDHAGADWTISSNTTVAGLHTNIGTFTVNTGVTATVQSYDGASYGSFQVSASTIGVVGTITATGKGYTSSQTSPDNGGDASPCSSGRGGAGGGHGGLGQASATGASGVSYGNFLEPISMGGAGGDGENFGCISGAIGGGTIKLNASGSLTLSGTINVNGNAAGSNQGGGAGGSIWIIGNTLAGNGTLIANGGAGGGNGGGGAGGRIAVHYLTGTVPTWTVTATKGSSAENGTVVFVDDTNNDILINNTQSWRAAPTLEGSVHTFRDISVSNSSTLSLYGYYTNNNDGVGHVFNVRNFTINTGSTVNLIGTGYQVSSPNGLGPNPGIGSCLDNNGGSGAGHGGRGGDGFGGSPFRAGGSVIGSLIAPILLGSSAGTANSGCNAGTAGGGAIKISATSISVGGPINANSPNTVTARTSGGAGGSVYLIADTVSGSSAISANGGNAVDFGGGGGGGRIALHYRVSNSYSGTVTATGGTSVNGGVGQNGTVIIIDDTNNDVTVPTTQYWRADTTLEGSLLNFRDVSITNSSTLYAVAYYTNGSDGVGLVINARNFSLGSGSSINGNYYGYVGSWNSAVNGTGPGAGLSGTHGSGAGHGTSGGASSFVAGGPAYESFLDPVLLGSGGGAGSCNASGGTGGGSIQIIATGNVLIDGGISVDASAGVVFSGCGTTGGGGSGGSVKITAIGNLSGTGTISARGGNGGAGNGGVGSGGRVYMSYGGSNTYSGTISTIPGAIGQTGGSGIGSNILIDSINNDLYIKSSQLWNLAPSFEGNTHTYHAVTITNNSTLTVPGYYTSGTNGVGEVFNVTNFTIDSGSTITASGRGYAGSAGSSLAGVGPGAGSGGSHGAGAGYGGTGGSGTNGGGTSYGSLYLPLDLGSGGGGGNCSAAGGAGGGAVKINATGNAVINGSITVDGSAGTLWVACGTSGGGGSGGSILILANSISGSGSLTSIGGNGPNANGGVGSGGRIALRYAVSNSYAGSTSAVKGVTGKTTGATDGTIYITAYPQVPTSLTQYKSDGTTVIASGANHTETSVVLKAAMAAGGNTTLHVEVEMRQIATSFTNVSTNTGSGVSYTGTPVTGSVTISGLSDLTSYHWQMRVCDANDCSSWVAYAGSPYDFRIVTNQDPTAPSSLGPSSVTTGNYIAINTPTLNFTLADPDVADTVKYEIIIDDTSNFSSPIVDYTSALTSQGSKSFTVGQAVGSGSYATGTQGQTLVDGSYYWKVKTIDNSNAVSGYSTANSGSIAFIVDQTSPLGPSGLDSFDHIPSDWSSDPTLSTFWIAASDAGSNVAGYYYLYNLLYNTDPTDSDSSLGAGATSVTSGIQSTSNSIYFHIRAYDAVDNLGTTVHSGPFFIDTTAPSVPGIPSTTTPTADTTPNWSWTSSLDTDSGLNNPAYSVQWCGDASFSGCSLNTDTSNTNSYTHATALSEGTWYFRTKAIDAVNNESSYSSNGSVLIDTSGPTSPSNVQSTSHDISVASADPTITMTWTSSTDSASGLAGYYYLYNLVFNTDPSASDSSLGPGATSVTSGTQSTSNSIYFHIRAYDALSNLGATSHSGPYYVDTTAPSIPGTPNTTNPTADTTPTWTWTSSFDINSVLNNPAYSVQWCNDSSFTGCPLNIATSNTNSFTHSTALSQGTWYFRVKATDSVNNESSYSSNGSVLIDTSGPTSPSAVSSSSHEISVASSDTTITMTWTSSADSASGLAGYYYLFDNNSTTTPTTLDEWLNSSSTTVDSPTLTLSNSNYFHIIAYDNAGNWSTVVHKGPYFINTTPSQTFGLTISEVANSDGKYYTNDFGTFVKILVSDHTPSVAFRRVNDDKYNVHTDHYEVKLEKSNKSGERFDSYYTWLSDINANPPSDSDSQVLGDMTIRYSDDEIKVTPKSDDLAIDSGTYYMKVKAFDEVSTIVTSDEVILVVADDLTAPETIIETATVTSSTNNETPLDNADRSTTPDQFTPSITPTPEVSEKPVDTATSDKKQNIKLAKIPKLIGSTLGSANLFAKNIAINQKAANTVSTTILLTLVYGIIFESIRNFVDLYRTAGAHNVNIALSFVFGFMVKRKQPWGVVYDAKTKMPLDPAIVELTSTVGKVYRAVTDMYGRYDFMVPAGTYSLKVGKTDFSYPSKIITNQLEELVYPDVISGQTIQVSPNSAVRFNIPLDPVKPNWNQEEKVKLGYKAPSVILTPFSRFLSFAGISWGLYSTVVNPNLVNITFALIFAVSTIYRISMSNYYRWGIVQDKKNKKIVGAIVNLVNSKYPNISPRTVVTDNWGRYNFLVSKSIFHIDLLLFRGGIKTKVYQSEDIEIKKDFDTIAKHITI